MTTLAPNRLRSALMGGASFAALSLGLFVVFQANDPEPYRLHTEETVAQQDSRARPAPTQQASPQPLNDVQKSLNRVVLSEPTVIAEEADAGPLVRQQDGALAKVGQSQPEMSRAIAPAPATATSFLADREIQPAPEARDRYANADANPVKLVAETPVSTFSIDVDTASMAIVRQSLMSGNMPPKEAVRTEELINYFPYDYPAPTGDAPFETTTTVMDAPWAEGRKLIFPYNDS